MATGKVHWRVVETYPLPAKCFMPSNSLAGALCVIFTILVSFLRDHALFVPQRLKSTFKKKLNGAVQMGQQSEEKISKTFI